MRPSRLLQTVAATLVGLGVLVASAVPAPAAIHGYDLDVTDLDIRFYQETFAYPYFDKDLDWSEGHHPCAADETLSIDDSGHTTSWEIELAGVVPWSGGWRRYTLDLTMSGYYVGSGNPYALSQAQGDLTMHLEAVSGATDCSPDSGVLCTVESDHDFTTTGALDDDGHGVGGLTATDTATMAGGNYDGETIVSGTAAGCGVLTWVNGGRFEIELDASGFS
jgi:hypothetical protein